MRKGWDLQTGNGVKPNLRNKSEGFTKALYDDEGYIKASEDTF